MLYQLSQGQLHLLPNPSVQVGEDVLLLHESENAAFVMDVVRPRLPDLFHGEGVVVVERRAGFVWVVAESCDGDLVADSEGHHDGQHAAGGDVLVCLSLVELKAHHVGRLEKDLWIEDSEVLRRLGHAQWDFLPESVATVHFTSSDNGFQPGEVERLERHDNKRPAGLVLLGPPESTLWIRHSDRCLVSHVTLVGLDGR